MLKYLKACPFCGHAPEVVKDPQIMGLFESKQFKSMSFELKGEKE